MLWECDGCGRVVESDPLGHSDWGGEVVVSGPDCDKCGQPMDYAGEGRVGPDGVVYEED
jgi:hypothetical protein